MNYKKIGSIFLTFVFVAIIIAVLVPGIMIFGVYLINLIYFPFVIVEKFYEMIYISLWASIFVFILIFIFLRYLKRFSFILNFVIALFIPLIVAIFGGLYEAESFIEKKAIFQLNKQPTYTNICLKSTLQLCPFRCENICFYPHSLVEKEGKCYYWSFRTEEFLELPETICKNVRK